MVLKVAHISLIDVDKFKLKSKVRSANHKGAYTNFIINFLSFL